MSALVWYRNDLRVADHSPLAAALACGKPVRAVYQLCPQQWDAHDVAPLRRWYVLESLRELGKALAAIGVSLEILESDDFSSAPGLLAALCKKHGVTDLYCNREYPLNELNRDRAVAQALRPLSVNLHGFDDGVLVPPRQLKTGKGTPYTVFTPYARAWRRWLADNPPLLPALPGGQKAVSFRRNAAIDRALQALSLNRELKQGWQPGERAARQMLDDFLAAGLADYGNARDFPARPGTSGLSTALSAGTLSAQRCYVLAGREMLGNPAAAEGARVWINELAWRDFYRQIMANFPGLARGLPFRPETACIRWNDNESLFRAWCDGRTGYPLVDAAMRQLRQTGWMHNRLRMVSAMFLSKHLFIDWRRGERWFMQNLMDGDLAANNGGWQWSASTGTDAAPYFRVFSPIRQSERFDAGGDFIRRLVPELAALNDKQIHQPWKHADLVPDYPAPVVEHKGVKEKVTAAFQAARQQSEEAGRA